MSESTKDKELRIINQANEIHRWEDAREFIEELPHLIWDIINLPGVHSYFEELRIPPLSKELFAAIVTMHERLKSANPPVSYDSFIMRYQQFLGRFLGNFPTREICEATWRWLQASPGPTVDAGEWGQLKGAIFKQWYLPSIWKLGGGGQGPPPVAASRPAWDYVAEVSARICHSFMGDWLIRGAILGAAGEVPKELWENLLSAIIKTQYAWSLDWIFQIYPEVIGPERIYSAVYSLMLEGRWNPFPCPEFDRIEKMCRFYEKNNYHLGLFEKSFEEYKRAWKETRAMQSARVFSRLPDVLENFPRLGSHVYVLGEVAKEELPLNVYEYLNARVWRLKEEIRLYDGMLDRHPEHPDRELTFRKLAVTLLIANGDHRPLLRAEEICRQYIAGTLSPWSGPNRFNVIHVYLAATILGWQGPSYVPILNQMFSKACSSEKVPSHLLSLKNNLQEVLANILADLADDPIEFLKEYAYISPEPLRNWRRTIKIGHLFSPSGPFAWYSEHLPRSVEKLRESLTQFPELAEQSRVLLAADVIFRELPRLFFRRGLVITPGWNLARDPDQFERFWGWPIPDFMGVGLVIHLRDPGRPERSEAIREKYLKKYAGVHAFTFLSIDSAGDWRADVERFLAGFKPNPPV